MEILQEAVARDASGALVLRDARRLRACAPSSPIYGPCCGTARQELRDGPVPEFAAVGGALDGVGQARLGWNLGDPPRGTARMRKVETGAGRVAVLTGPASSITARNALIGAGLVLWKMVLPIALMTRSRRRCHPSGGAAQRIDARRPSRPVASTSIVAKRDCPWATCRKKPPRWCGGQRRAGQAGRRLCAPPALPGRCRMQLRTPIAILNMRLEGLAGRAGARPPAGGRGAPVLAGGTIARRAALERDSAAAAAGPGRAGARRHGGAGAAGRWRRVPDRIRVGAGPVTVAGDRPALERAVSNLVQNAIQHGGRRGVITLRVHGVRARSRSATRATACRQAGGKTSSNPSSGVAAQHGCRPGPEPGGPHPPPRRRSFRGVRAGRRRLLSP